MMTKMQMTALLEFGTMTKGAEIRTGHVKSFYPEQGYGFVKPDAPGLDVFLHITALQRSGWTEHPAAGWRVRYTVRDRGANRVQIDTIERV